MVGDYMKEQACRYLKKLLLGGYSVMMPRFKKTNLMVRCAV